VALVFEVGEQLNYTDVSVTKKNQSIWNLFLCTWVCVRS